MLSCARSLLLGMKMLQIIHNYIENVKKAFDEENIKIFQSYTLSIEPQSHELLRILFYE